MMILSFRKMSHLKRIQYTKTISFHILFFLLFNMLSDIYGFNGSSYCLEVQFLNVRLMNPFQLFPYVFFCSKCFIFYYQIGVSLVDNRPTRANMCCVFIEWTCKHMQLLNYNHAYLYSFNL